MYTVEYANGDSQRRHQECRHELNCEVIERGVSGVPHIVCLASHDDAVRLTALLNATDRSVERYEDEPAAEREERQRYQTALNEKDKAMGILFDRLYSAGVDCSDLIP